MGRRHHPPASAAEGAPTIPISPAPTIMYAGTGETADGHHLVALTVSTNLGVNTYMIEPTDAHQVAEMITHAAATAHLANYSPEELADMAAADAERMGAQS